MKERESFLCSVINICHMGTKFSMISHSYGMEGWIDGMIGRNGGIGE